MHLKTKKIVMANMLYTKSFSWFYHALISVRGSSQMKIKRNSLVKKYVYSIPVDPVIGYEV